MAMTDDTREKLAFLFTKVGMPSDTTDWLEDIPDSEKLYVAEVQPDEADAERAADIMRAGGVPTVFILAIQDGLAAYDYQMGDPNPTTQWYLGATA